MKKKEAWQFRTRKAAEEAARFNADQRDLNALAMNGMLDGSLMWLPTRYGDGNSYYRFGYIRGIAETVIVIALHHHSVGEKPFMVVHHESFIAESIAMNGSPDPKDAMACAFADGIREMRRLVNDFAAHEAEQKQSGIDSFAKLADKLQSLGGPETFAEQVFAPCGCTVSPGYRCQFHNDP